jgi:adenosylhomocysteine nucleosidase
MNSPARRRPFASLATALLFAALALLQAGCVSTASMQTGSAPAMRLDAAPRLAIISAFQPELTLLLTRVQDARRHSVNGV